jgi:hypothetical protein
MVSVGGIRVRTLEQSRMGRRRNLPSLPDRVLIEPLLYRMARVTRPAIHAVPTIVRRTIRRALR